MRSEVTRFVPPMFWLPFPLATKTNDPDTFMAFAVKPSQYFR